MTLFRHKTYWGFEQKIFDFKLSYTQCCYTQTNIAEVTPVLGVSETCYNASLEYIHGGFHLVRFSDPLWVGDPD